MKTVIKTGRTKARGFTLVELLVALAISAILILALQSAFRLGVMLWWRVEAPRPFEEQGRQVVTLMRSELAGLYLPNVKQDQGPPIAYQEDGENGQWSLSFFTTTPAFYRGLPPGRCARVTYAYRRLDESGSGGGVLIRREQWAAGEKVIAESVTDVAAEQVSACSVRLLDGKGEPYRIGEKSGRAPAMVAVDLRWPATPYTPGHSRPTQFQSMLAVPVQGSVLPEKQE